MDKRKSVLVTGASSGIGRACAHALDQRGWRVFAGVRRDEDAALARENSGSVWPVRLDVTVASQIDDVARLIEQEVGAAGLDSLVNNAGIVTAGPLEFLPLADIREEFEVNTFGPIAVTQAMLPLLRIARGRVVTISSVSARIALPIIGPYAASKFALEAFLDCAAARSRANRGRRGGHTARTDRDGHAGEVDSRGRRAVRTPAAGSREALPPVDGSRWRSRRVRPIEPPCPQRRRANGAGGARGEAAAAAVHGAPRRMDVPAHYQLDAGPAARRGDRARARSFSSARPGAKTFRVDRFMKPGRRPFLFLSQLPAAGRESYRWSRW